MRKIFRTALIITLGALAVAVAVTAWRSLGPGEGATWSTVAAVLAVITSLIAVWNGQRILELQEDAQQPYPYPSIDFESRYSLMQLRVTNYGGSVARNINLKWDKPLLDPQARQVRFTEQEEAPDIAVLLPGQSIATLVGTDIEMFNKYKDMNYSGAVEFANASGRTSQHSFYLSAEQYRGSPTHEQEGLKTHYQLQQVPNELRKLNSELKKVRALFEKS
jgi:hypothetical protein